MENNDISKDIGAIAFVVIVVIICSTGFYFFDKVNDRVDIIISIAILLFIVVAILQIGPRKLLAFLGFGHFLLWVMRTFDKKKGEERRPSTPAGVTLINYEEKYNNLNQQLQEAQNRHHQEQGVLNSRLNLLIENERRLQESVTNLHQVNDALTKKIQELQREIRAQRLYRLEAPLNNPVKPEITKHLQVKAFESPITIKTSNLYLYAPINGVFYKTSNVLVPPDTIYKLSEVTEFNATFEFVEDENTLSQIFSYVDSLKDTCDLFGTGRPSPQKFRYRANKKGRVEREGNNWRITEKIQLEWD